MYVNFAMPSCCKTLYMWIMQCYLVARHYICELCNAMLFSQSSCMWIISCYHCFCITCSIFRQHLYIQLLFMCISHLKRWWRNLEWKQGLQSRQCYPLKQISCWLQIAPQRRIQREMTSHIPPEVHALTWLGYIAHIMHMVSCIAMPFS